MSKKDKKSLSWDDFVKLGNPENAPDMPIEEEVIDKSAMTIRVHLEKKKRAGKSVSIIKGLDIDDDKIDQLAKKIKSVCGVGGSSKHGEILIQGNHRDKIIDILKNEGYKNIKKAGG
ncbi:MAG: translation initiation factor [Saprospiraceae bacterium]